VRTLPFIPPRATKAESAIPILLGRAPVRCSPALTPGKAGTPWRRCALRGFGGGGTFRLRALLGSDRVIVRLLGSGSGSLRIIVSGVRRLLCLLRGGIGLIGPLGCGLRSSNRLIGCRPRLFGLCASHVGDPLCISQVVSRGATGQQSGSQDHGHYAHPQNMHVKLLLQS
jgi:hypothetical protein